MAATKRHTHSPSSSEGGENKSEISTEMPPVARVLDPSLKNQPSLPSMKKFKQGTEKIGSILHRVREHRGEDLNAISEHLHIRSEFLLALEESRYADLPADAYVIGFLRSYAAYLGLEGKGAVDLYRREMAGQRRKPSLSMPEMESETHTPTAALLIGVVILAIVLYALWYGFASSDRTTIDVPPPVLPQSSTTEMPKNENAAPPASSATPQATEPLPPVQPETTTAPTPAQDPPAPQTPPTTPPPENTTGQSSALPSVPLPLVKPTPPQGTSYGDPAPTARLILRAEQESWILITDKSGNTIFDQILKPGDIYKVPNSKGLSLTTSNGGGTILSLDGSDLPRPADKARIVRGIPLDPDRLKAHGVQPE